MKDYSISHFGIYYSLSFVVFAFKKTEMIIQLKFLIALFFSFLLVLIIEINQTNYRYYCYEYWNCYCSHNQTSFSSFSFLTNKSPTPNVAAEAKITQATINGFFISQNVDDNKSAVTIYLAISISHFPNSFLMLQSYTYFWLLGYFLLWKECQHLLHPIAHASPEEALRCFLL